MHSAILVILVVLSQYTDIFGQGNTRDPQWNRRFIAQSTMTGVEPMSSRRDLNMLQAHRSNAVQTSPRVSRQNISPNGQMMAAVDAASSTNAGAVSQEPDSFSDSFFLHRLRQGNTGALFDLNQLRQASVNAPSPFQTLAHFAQFLPEGLRQNRTALWMLLRNIIQQQRMSNSLALEDNNIQRNPNVIRTVQMLLNQIQSVNNIIRESTQNVNGNTVIPRNSNRLGRNQNFLRQNVRQEHNVNQAPRFGTVSSSQISQGAHVQNPRLISQRVDHFVNREGQIRTSIANDVHAPNIEIPATNTLPNNRDKTGLSDNILQRVGTIVNINGQIMTPTRTAQVSNTGGHATNTHSNSIGISEIILQRGGNVIGREGTHTTGMNAKHGERVNVNRLPENRPSQTEVRLQRIGNILGRNRQQLTRTNQQEATGDTPRVQTTNVVTLPKNDVQLRPQIMFQHVGNVIHSDGTHLNRDTGQLNARELVPGIVLTSTPNTATHMEEPRITLQNVGNIHNTDRAALQPNIGEINAGEPNIFKAAQPPVGNGNRHRQDVMLQNVGDILSSDGTLTNQDVNHINRVMNNGRPVIFTVGVSHGDNHVGNGFTHRSDVMLQKGGNILSSDGTLNKQSIAEINMVGHGIGPIISTPGTLRNDNNGRHETQIVLQRVGNILDRNVGASGQHMEIVPQPNIIQSSIGHSNGLNISSPNTMDHIPESRVNEQRGRTVTNTGGILWRHIRQGNVEDVIPTTAVPNLRQNDVQSPVTLQKVGDISGTGGMLLEHAIGQMVQDKQMSSSNIELTTTEQMTHLPVNINQIWNQPVGTNIHQHGRITEAAEIISPIGSHFGVFPDNHNHVFAKEHLIRQQKPNTFSMTADISESGTTNVEMTKLPLSSGENIKQTHALERDNGIGKKTHPDVLNDMNPNLGHHRHLNQRGDIGFLVSLVTLPPLYVGWHRLGPGNIHRPVKTTIGIGGTHFKNGLGAFSPGRQIPPEHWTRGIPNTFLQNVGKVNFPTNTIDGSNHISSKTHFKVSPVFQPRTEHIGPELKPMSETPIIHQQSAGKAINGLSSEHMKPQADITIVQQGKPLRVRQTQANDMQSKFLQNVGKSLADRLTPIDGALIAHNGTRERTNQVKSQLHNAFLQNAGQILADRLTPIDGALTAHNNTINSNNKNAKLKTTTTASAINQIVGSISEERSLPGKQINAQRKSLNDSQHVLQNIGKLLADRLTPIDGALGALNGASNTRFTNNKTHTHINANGGNKLGTFIVTNGRGIGNIGRTINSIIRIRKHLVTDATPFANRQSNTHENARVQHLSTKHILGNIGRQVLNVGRAVIDTVTEAVNTELGSIIGDDNRVFTGFPFGTVFSNAGHGELLTLKRFQQQRTAHDQISGGSTANHESSRNIISTIPKTIWQQHNMEKMLTARNTHNTNTISLVKQHSINTKRIVVMSNGGKGISRNKVQHAHDNVNVTGDMHKQQPTTTHTDLKGTKDLNKANHQSRHGHHHKTETGVSKVHRIRNINTQHTISSVPQPGTVDTASGTNTVSHIKSGGGSIPIEGMSKMRTQGHKVILTTKNELNRSPLPILKAGEGSFTQSVNENKNSISASNSQHLPGRMIKQGMEAVSIFNGNDKPKTLKANAQHGLENQHGHTDTMKSNSIVHKHMFRVPSVPMSNEVTMINSHMHQPLGRSSETAVVFQDTVHNNHHRIPIVDKVTFLTPSKGGGNMFRSLKNDFSTNMIAKKTVIDTNNIGITFVGEEAAGATVPPTNHHPQTLKRINISRNRANDNRIVVITNPRTSDSRVNSQSGINTDTMIHFHKNQLWQFDDMKNEVNSENGQKQTIALSETFPVLQRHTADIESRKFDTRSAKQIQFQAMIKQNIIEKQKQNTNC